MKRFVAALALLLGCASAPAAFAAATPLVGIWHGTMVCGRTLHTLSLIAYPPQGDRDVGDYAAVRSEQRSDWAASDMVQDASGSALVVTLDHWRGRDLGAIRFSGVVGGDSFAGRVRNRPECGAVTLYPDRNPETLAAYQKAAGDPMAERRQYMATFSPPPMQNIYAATGTKVEAAASGAWSATKWAMGSAWSSISGGVSSAAKAATSAVGNVAAVSTKACSKDLSVSTTAPTGSRSVEEIDSVLEPARRTIAAASDAEKIVLLQARLVEMKLSSRDPVVERYRAALVACYSDAQAHLAKALFADSKIPITDWAAIANGLYQNGAYYLGYQDKPDVLSGLTGLSAVWDAASRFSVNKAEEVRAYQEDMASADRFTQKLENLRTIYVRART